MRKFRWWLALPALLAAGAAGSACGADAPMAEIVVAMRYFQESGTSHAHLYLYREDGKLLRQLTDDNTGQDFSPVFSPDGESILFGRDNGTGATEYYTVAPRGGSLRKVGDTPNWYNDFKVTPFFTSPEDEPGSENLLIETPDSPGKKPAAPGPPLTYRAPDGSVELVLAVSAANEADAFDGEGHGKSYLLRDLKGGGSMEMGKLPGFFGLFNLMELDKDHGQRFLLVPPLRVAFFDLHLDSTDGSTVFALDLEKRRLVRLSPNWAAPMPLPGEPAFLTYTENRYVPFGHGQKTANSSYIERWDATLKAVRFAREKAAGVTYGASMYRPGKTPAVINMHGTDVPVPDKPPAKSKPGTAGEGGI